MISSMNNSSNKPLGINTVSSPKKSETHVFNDPHNQIMSEISESSESIKSFFLAPDQIAHSKSEKESQIMVYTNLVTRKNMLSCFDASKYTHPELYIVNDTEYINLAVPSEFDCNIPYTEDSSQLCIHSIYDVKSFSDTPIQQDQVADIIKDAPDTRIILGRPLNTNSTTPSVVIFLNKVDFERYTQTHPNNKDVVFISVDAEYEWQAETRNLLFKLPYGCMPKNSILSTISYISSEYGPSFPFPLVKNGRMRLSDRDANALIVVEQWEKLHGGPPNTTQMINNKIPKNYDSFAHFQTVLFSCDNDDNEKSFTALTKRQSANFLYENYTDTGYFLGQLTDNNTSQFLRSNVWKFPFTISLEFQAIIDNSSSPTDPPKNSNTDGCLMFYLRNASLFIGVLFLLYKVAHFINHKISRAQEAKQVTAKRKKMEQINSSIRTFHNNLKNILINHPTEIKNNTITFTKLPPDLCSELKNLKLETGHTILYYSSSNKLIFQYNIDEISSSSLEPLTTFNQQLVKLFTDLSENLKNHKLLLDREEELAQEQQNETSEYQIKKNSYENNYAVIIKEIKKLKENDVNGVRDDNNVLTKIQKNNDIETNLNSILDTLNGLENPNDKIKTVLNKVNDFMARNNALKNSINNHKNNVLNLNDHKKGLEIEIRDLNTAIKYQFNDWKNNRTS